MSWQYDHHPLRSDDQYLFRLTSTFGWDDAISFCKSLALGIEIAAANKAKEATSSAAAGDDGYYCPNDSLMLLGGDGGAGEQPSLEDLLAKARAQLYYTDQWGNRPLHAACYVKPPATVVDALFRLGRAIREHGDGGGREEDAPPVPLFATPSKDGSTPFLVACSTGASSRVLHRFLDEVEHYVDRRWVDHPRMARMLVIRPDDQGATPLAAWTSFHKLTLFDYPNTRRQREHWDLACRMLLLATMNVRPHTPHSTPVLVHRCAEIATYCPLSLLEWAVTHRRDDDYEGLWFPADVCARTADTLGKLPLHRAMEAVDIHSVLDEDVVHHGADFDDCDYDGAGVGDATRDSRRDDGSAAAATTIEAAETVCPREDALLYNYADLEGNRVLIMRKLLRWHPGAARVPFPGNGRPPLIQAIAHGGTWHRPGCYRDGDGVDSVGGGGGNHSDCGDGDDSGVLRLLWGHAPEKSSEIDPVTGLFPFMLAAAVVPTRGRRNYDDRDAVDTVYNLLRKDPQLVARALNNTDEAA